MISHQTLVLSQGSYFLAKLSVSPPALIACTEVFYPLLHSISTSMLFRILPHYIAYLPICHSGNQISYPLLCSIVLLEVKTCIALRKEVISSRLFQLVYMYNCPIYFAVLGPLAICMIIHPYVLLVTLLSRICDGVFPTPSLTPSYPCYHRREVSAIRVHSCFEALVILAQV